jgi:hypothetical protein
LMFSLIKLVLFLTVEDNRMYEKSKRIKGRRRSLDATHGKDDQFFLP